MGLFGFLKSFGKVKEVSKEGRKPLPTITPDKAIHDCYEIVFRREFANVTGISPGEAEEIYKLISQSENGFLSAGTYHSIVYEKYFKGRDWAWTEYDKWNDRFSKLGRYPTSFQPKIGSKGIEKALNGFSVAELKDLLKSKGIEFSSKAKKQDLMDLVARIPNIGNEQEIIKQIEQDLEKERHSIYTILMRTINFRGKNLFDHKRAKSIGVKKFEILPGYDSDEDFVKMALKENPNSLPPLYPYDLSLLKPVIDF